LALRWERAQQIDRSAIQDMGQGWFRVPSSQGAASYVVHLDFDAAGKLAAASCSCPDFARPTSGMGIPLLHSTVKVCKHILSASLKARDTGQHAPTFERGCNGHNKPDSTHGTAGAVKPVEVSGNPLPAAGKPIWDEECQEWVLTASDRRHYCGTTPSQCIQQFDEALHYQADHARKNDPPVEELSECPAPSACAPDDAQVQEPAQIAEFRPRAEAATDHNRRLALSRARGIANQARPLGTAYRLYGIAQGDVLDCPERLMFFAVISVIPQGMCAKGVSQEEPSGTVRDVRMGAAIVRLRLQEGGLIKVRDLRR